MLKSLNTKDKGMMHDVKQETLTAKLLTLLVFNSFPYSSAWQYQAQGLVNLAVNWEEKQPLGS